MRRLFRSFDRSGLEYLLISGQASVVYGAATFSEDLDLWIRPTPPNARRLLVALGSCGARVHKLTPALTPRNIKGGHGFHFVVPSGRLPVYLDVMGCPPRVGSFDAARLRSARTLTPWGKVPVVSIEDLVALKKTRRFSDYEVISNLVTIRLAAAKDPSPALLQWAAMNTFRAEDRAGYLLRLGRRESVKECRKRIAGEVARLQARDTAYWRVRIKDLRRLRSLGRMLPEGTPVKQIRSSR